RCRPRARAGWRARRGSSPDPLRSGPGSCGQRHGQPEPEAALRSRARLELAAEPLRPLAEPAQPGAGRAVGDAASVVLDLHGGAPAVRVDADRAVLRAAVPNDVRRTLADGPGEHGVHVLREHDLTLAERAVDARGRERLLRPFELVCERQPPVALNSLADAGERIAGHRLDVVQLGRGTLRLALDELARQLALQCDHRQAVTEQVVEVTGDSQPLLRDGQPRQLLARRA